ncbi:GSCFA domain-containing protein [Capnocytophaga sp.]|uniref:GSCFA domain-containing protein n=1 Tax=Capnocytophaga sp. TaxID=44737 RepID=UPI0026DA8B86|nr:GSCFA domain-containing protein [Capnocytophaga sp.]MDO5104704.1 GSCFA domain-containing protein [Capnocytophaga sp.]
MEFRTVVPTNEITPKIGYHSKIVSLGSCFAVNIAQKLHYHKFQVVSNPFGILFHPLAIEKIITKSMQNAIFSEEDFFQHNDLWHCFDFHSELSQLHLINMVKIANQQSKQLQTGLQEADFVFITLGTAWIYEHHQHGIVANCHKLPQTEFSKRLLTINEIENSLQNSIWQIKNSNPSAKIVFTISPVRHLKDGFTQNQISKAHLISGLHSFLTKNTDVAYFPAYEIMTDELRDYRFYADDMLHPSQVAIDYIWERFINTLIDPNCLADMKSVDSIQKGLKHKPFNPESEQFLAFRKNLETKIEALKHKFKTYNNPLEF